MVIDFQSGILIARDSLNRVRRPLHVFPFFVGDTTEQQTVLLVNRPRQTVEKSFSCGIVRVQRAKEEGGKKVKHEIAG